MLIDTHCHLDFTQFDSDREEVIKRAKLNKVQAIINIGTDLNSSLKSRDIASEYDNIFFSLGFHPHYADDFNESLFKDGYIFGQRIEDLTNNRKLVAIGEVGLDYYKSLSERKTQQKVFLRFIEISQKLNLPLVVHSRESQDDVFSILRSELDSLSQVVFHCFSGPFDFLEKCLDLGAMFSFTANVTYPKASAIRDFVRRLPLRNIMLETDAPYLSPQKFRGQRNEPAYVNLVAQEVAEIKNCSIEEVASTTTSNAKRFFNLKKS